MDCIFCKIVKGEIPAKVLYEDDKIIAFADANPQTKGHTLVVPKEHTLDITTIPEETLIYILKKAKDIAETLEKEYHYDGFTLVQNNGFVEKVKHFHLHIIPQYEDNPKTNCKC